MASQTATAAHRRWRRPHAKRVVALVLPVALLVAGGLVLNSDLSLLDPTTGLWALTAPWGNSTYTLSGLEHPVTVVYDGAGTIHIYAQDDQDLFYAQGYTQAANRLFQMEAESLEAQGNISSWVGSSGEASDRAFRLLGLPHAALEMQADLTTDQPALAPDIFAYCDGVNAYISWAEQNHRLPLEFQSLGILPYTWTPFALFAFERLMVYSQTTGVAEPLYAGLAADAVGDNATNQMFPVYPQYYQNYTVLPGNGTIDGTSLESLQGVSSSEVFSQDWLAGWASGVPNAERQSLEPLLEQAISNIDDPYFPTYSVDQGGGSNSWVVSANHSADGLPMVANDPHLPIMLPSLWVPTQLVDPSYDVEGWALAGLPGILIGHDPSLAWALTNSEGDTALEYVETLHGDLYLYDGTWRPLTWWNSSFQVLGGTTQSVDLAYTNNGPLIGRDGDYGISVNWAADGPTWEAMAELQFDRAVSIDQFFSIMEEYWTIPNLNVLIAEDNATSGQTHIGWMIPCHYPLINETLPGGPTIQVVGSRVPLNGSGGFEPDGVIPVQLQPQSIDPAQGYLYAPNQPTVGQDYPYPFIGSFWDSGGRGHAIGNFLAQHPTMSIPLMEDLQANVTDQWAVALTPQLESALSSVASSGGPAASLASEALPVVQGWNGSFDVNEVGATIYTYWYDEVVLSTYSHVLWTAGVGGFPDPFPNAILWMAENDPTSSWFTDSSCSAAGGSGGCDWSEVSQQAASSALLYLSANLSARGIHQMSGWTWGVVHPFTLPSLTGVSYLADGPYPHWGDGYTVSVAPFSTAITLPLTQTSLGSSLRMIAEPDPSQPDGGTALGIIPGGATEDPASPYYDNQLPLWLAHEYVNMALVPAAAGPFPQQVVATWDLQP